MASKKILADLHVDGKVGVGTTNPLAELDVVGVARMDEGITESIHYIGEGIEHWGDEGTGLHFPANDNITLKTSSLERLRIDSAGNVGIGTDNPTTKLHVLGGGIRFTDVGPILTSEATNGTSGLRINVIGATGGGLLRVQENGSTKVQVNYNGDVGIGTTSPQAKLDVESEILISGTDPILRMDRGDGFNSDILKVESSTDNLIIGDSSLDDIVFEADSGEAMRISSNLNVGIGASVPIAKLHLFNPGFPQLNLESNAGSWQVGVSSGNDFAFRKGLTGSDYPLWLDSSSNVGIGTTSPGTKLEVGSGHIRLTNAYSLQWGSANDRIYNESSNTVFVNNANESMRILTNGNIGIGTTNPVQKLQVGDGTADDVIRTVYSDGEYTDIHGYGITMSRSNSYIRPILTNTQTLYIGSSTNNWSNIVYKGSLQTFGNDTNEWMRITTAGNLGIGTETPSEKLEVVGNTKLDGQLEVTDLPFSSTSTKILTQEEELSGELITNGGFDTDSDWTKNLGITVSGGSANFTSQSGQYLSQDMLVSGTNYLLTFDVSAYTSGALTIFGGAGNGITGSVNSVDNYSFYFTAGGSDTKLYFGNVFTGSIDNVSVREVISSSDDIKHIRLGSNAFTNSAENFWQEATNGINYNDGRVGIGTSSPSDLLDIYGAGGITVGYNSSGSSIRKALVHKSAGVERWSLNTISVSNFSINVDNSERLRIDNNGNVGIGTTSPQAKFVVSNDGAAGMEFQPELGTDTNRILNYDRITSTYMNLRLDANAYQFRISGSEEVTITSDGNVGIGTTSPSSKLQVHGTFLATENGTIEGRTNLKKDLIIRGNDVSANQGAVRFYVDNSNRLLIDTGNDGADLFVIDGSGNVGIGTTTPSSKLHIDGGVGSLSTGLSFGDGDTGIWEGSDDDLRFSTNSSTRMIIKSSGNVGLGTDNPLYNLDIADTEATINLAKTDGDQYLRLVGGSGTNSDVIAQRTLTLQALDGDVLLQPTGNVGIGTTSPNDKLHISAGAIRIDNFYQLRWGGTGTGIYGHSTQGLNFFTDSGTTRLKIEDGGNVGIGTDTPVTKLDVRGGMIVAGDTPSTAYASATLEVYRNGNTSSLLIHQDNAAATTKFAQLHLRNGGNDTYIKTPTGDHALIIDTESITNAVAIRIGGRVGIGTTDPEAKLSVDGGIQMADDTDTASLAKVGTMRYRTGTEYVEVTGTDLITNNDFSNGGAGWTLTSGASITALGARLQHTPSAGLVTQGNPLVVGKFYKLTYEVTEAVSGGLKINSAVEPVMDSTVGTHTKYFEADNTSFSVSRTNSTSNDITITDVSVVEVTEEDASYADMCMQTGSSTYEWVNVIKNTY